MTYKRNVEKYEKYPEMILEPHLVRDRIKKAAGERYQDLRIGTLEPRNVLQQKAREFILKFEPITNATGLLLLGSAGCGKSAILHALNNSIVEYANPDIHITEFWNEPELYAIMSARWYTDRDRFPEVIRRRDYIFIDEFGTIKATEDSASIYAAFFDSCYKRNVRLFIGSNYSAKELSARYPLQAIRKLFDLTSTIEHFGVKGKAGGAAK